MMIHPHKGVDRVEFGMTRAEVGRVLDGVPTRGRRNDFDVADYDFFESIGLFVYYDASDTCHAVEFTRDARVSYEGYELFGRPALEVRSWARAQDQDLDDQDGFVSTGLGLSMYAPAIDEMDLEPEERAESAESFLAFRPGYYEEERKRLSAARP